MKKPFLIYTLPTLRIARKTLLTALFVPAMLCALAVLVLEMTAPEITSITRNFDNKAEKIPSLPDMFDAPNDAISHYEITLQKNDWPYIHMQVYADDCLRELKINGKNIPLPGGCPGVENDLAFDISSRLHDGNNTLEMKVYNVVGPTGIDIGFWPLNFEVERALKIFGMTAFVMALLIRFGLDRRIGKPLTVMLGFAALLTLLHYFSSLYYDFAYDMSSHIDYINVLYNTHALPEPLGWHFHQPPLYYIGAALFYAAGVLTGASDPLYAARFFSLLLHLSFIVVSMLILARYLKDGYLLLAGAIVLFWPDVIVTSGRLSNDLGINIAHALLVYWLVRWSETKLWRYLLYSICTGFIAMAIKGTAVIGLGIVGSTIVIALFNREIRLRMLFRWPILLSAAFGLSISLGRTLYYRVTHQYDLRWIWNVNLSEIPIIVPNTPYQFIAFDYPDFFHNLFFFNNGSTGSEFFWNAFLKLILFGEADWRSPILATMLCFLLLVFLLYILYFLFFKLRRRELAHYQPLLLSMGWMIGALMVSRMMIPWPAQCNGRYIIGVVVIWAIFYAESVRRAFEDDQIILACTGVVAGVAFMLLTICIIVPMYPLFQMVVHQ